MAHRGWLVAIVLAAALVAAGNARAGSMLRVGNQVLSAGDSAGRVLDLLGEPGSRSHAGNRRRASGRHHRGAVVPVGRVERWNYRRDGRYLTVTLTDGVVSDIEERRR